MQIVIDIPKTDYEACKEQVKMIEQEGVFYESSDYALKKSIAKGIRLPKGHGRLIEWFKVREETKTEIEDCFPEEMGGCGGKKCMEVRYIRNPVTLEWQTAGGKCKCGMSFIV